MVRDYTGTARTVAVVNGTCALNAALSIVGAGPDTLVITQGLTFVATANAITHTGAQPIFLDSDRETMGLCPEALVRFLENFVERRDGISVHRETGKRLAACVPMHVFGHACRIDELVCICDEWGIPLVEDAAEALGSTYKGKALGTWGKVGILSFNGNKTITTGGGGMILTHDLKLGKWIKHLVNTAKKKHAWEFSHDAIGWNYRMPNINAALGCAQMERLDVMLASKREIARGYRNFFSTIPALKFMAEPEGCHSNYWLCAVLFPDKGARDDFLEYSNGHGVMTRPVWNLMPDLDIYSEAINDGLRIARELADRLVNLPSGVVVGSR
jgi:aminotransferase in exopolysaccharide biosynthesis